MDSVEMLRAMLLIRTFENVLARHRDRGFQLFSAGEEAVAVGLCAALNTEDQLLTNGRSIGFALARGLEPGLIMAEVLGKSAGPCRGKGGRGHLAQPSSGFFGAHSVVGGNLTIAAGVALAAQIQRQARVVVCVFGDGACGSGALHETLNIAALWRLPLLLVCNNNQYSVSTPRSQALAPQLLSDLAEPFGIPGVTIDGTDVVSVRDAVQVFGDRARSGQGPSLLECVSYRFASHSTATRETRSAEEISALKQHCPILRHVARLQAKGALAADTLTRLESEVDDVVAQAVCFADAAPYPARAEVLSDVL
jgi:TPP-dependent pyruvate/acetoin dehydrogenase alpha subunit